MYRNKYFKYISILITCCIISLAGIPCQVEASEIYDRFYMTYIFGSNSSVYIKSIDKTDDSLDTISPDYFGVDQYGNLVIYSKIDKNFINEMHSRNIKVTPYISNEWNRESGSKALLNRENLVSQIKSAIYEYNLDGINVDVENVDHLFRDDYTGFVRLLKQNLPDKVVSVAVAANPNNWTLGWHGSYDYHSLAQYSDYIMLMAYDEHYSGGEPGPVASASFVEKSILYALDNGVPKEKLVLGIPFYGRYWVSGQQTGGYGIASSDAESIVQKYNGTISYDEISQTAIATVTINDMDEKPRLWSGVYLNAGTYTIWYDNDRALKYKLDLVKKHDLKGVGSWSLGQEPSDTWSYFNEYLNGVHFTDLINHWSRSHVMDIFDKGWMIGTAPNTFSPDKNLTRAEAAVIMVRALGLSDETAEDSFEDTSNHWARREINIAKKYNIFSGVGNNFFQPDRPITREEAFVVLVRTVNMPETGIFPVQEFSDISRESNSWSYDSIIKLSSNGIVFGFSNGTCRPGEKISRAEMAAIMNRASRFEMKKPQSPQPFGDMISRK